MACRKRLTDQYPFLNNDPLPIKPYVSEDSYLLEQEKVFRRCWLFVGRADQIANSGDYFTCDIEIADTNILIVRGEDGTVRAFHNICQHRGHPVALQRHGRDSNGFICEFHNWTYRLDGSLKGIPDADNFYCVEKKNLGLKQIHCSIWESNIFVNLAPSPDESLSEYLGDLGQKVAGFPWQSLVPVATMTTVLKCNWKLLMDAFNEAYHVIGLHRRSAPDAFNGPENPFAHLQAAVLYDRHWTLSAYANPRQQLTPAASLNTQYSRAATYVPKHKNVTTLPPGVNPSKSSNWAFDIHQIFPNFSYYTASGWILCQSYWPIQVDSCRFQTTLYASEPTSLAQRVAMEHTLVMLWDVVLEDLSTVERTQALLRSGVQQGFVLSDMEIGLRHFAYVLRNALSTE